MGAIKWFGQQGQHTGLAYSLKIFFFLFAGYDHLGNSGQLRLLQHGCE